LQTEEEEVSKENLEVMKVPVEPEALQVEDQRTQRAAMELAAAEVVAEREVLELDLAVETEAFQIQALEIHMAVAVPEEATPMVEMVPQVLF
jgi:hypothetical protein